ncbi:MAG: exodeoxyribonuclease 7 small subunit [Candidatus Binatia bacterium]|nr:MAG: exodeoxyribonuclease 7 small subunit [Candidatus Binatia bacterium]
MKFEERLAELEGIVRKLESGDLPLEEALAAFEQGVALVRELHGLLAEARQRVEVLATDTKGKVRLEPFPDPEDER